MKKDKKEIETAEEANGTAETAGKSCEDTMINGGEIEEPCEKIELLEDIAEELESIVKDVKNSAIDTPKPKPKRKWKKIAIWSTFILIIVGVFVFTLLNDLLGDKPISFAGLRHHWWYLVIAAAVSAAFFVCRGIFFAIMMHLFTGKPRVGTSMSVATIGFFYDNVTPFGTGGQPFQIHYLQDKGLPKGAAITLPVVEYVVSSLVVVLISVVAIILSATNTFGNFVKMSDATRTALYITATIGIVLNFGLPFLLTVSLFSKKACKKVTRFTVRTAAFLKLTKRPDKLYKKIMSNLNANINCMKVVVKKKRLLLCVLFSFGEVLAGVSIGYFVIKAFGFVTPHGWGWAEIVMLTMLIKNSVTFIPTPGNSGAADLSFYLVFYGALAISTGAATGAVATLFWRMLSFYLPILFGFIIVILISAKKKKLFIRKNKKEVENEKKV